MEKFSGIIIFGALIVSGGAWADSGATQLDCYKIKDEERQEYRTDRNRFKGIYVGRLTIRSSDNKVVWATPKNSKDGPDGEFQEGVHAFKIVDDKFEVAFFKREQWIHAVDLFNKKFIALNRRDGTLVRIGMPWSSINDGPYTYRFEGMEAQCEVVENLF